MVVTKPHVKQIYVDLLKKTVDTTVGQNYGIWTRIMLIKPTTLCKFDLRDAPSVIHLILFCVCTDTEQMYSEIGINVRNKVYSFISHQAHVVGL